MSITHRNSASNSVSAQAITISVPSGVVDGDVMIAVVEVAATAGTVASTTFTAPSGWTSVANSVATNTRMQTWIRVASSEPASYQWTIAGGVDRAITGIIAAWSGGDTSTPQDTTAAAGAGTNSPMVAPTITTVTAGAMLVCAWGNRAGSGDMAVPGGMTERAEAGAGPDIIIGEKLITPAGVTGTQSVTSASNNWAAVAIALRPAAAAGDAPLSRPFAPPFRGAFG